MICPRCGAETDDWPCPECGFPESMKIRRIRRAKWRRITLAKHCLSNSKLCQQQVQG